MYCDYKFELVIDKIESQTNITINTVDHIINTKEWLILASIYIYIYPVLDSILTQVINYCNTITFLNNIVVIALFFNYNNAIFLKLQFFLNIIIN